MLRQLGKTIERIDWGHFFVLNSIALYCGWYFFDTYTTSTSINNLIFILPATLVAFALYLIILPSVLVQNTEDQGGRTEILKKLKANAMPALLVVAFALFVSSIERIGFDIGSYLFILLGLIICGERNWISLLLIPPIATVLLVLGFNLMIPYPIPLTIIR